MSGIDLCIHSWSQHFWKYGSMGLHKQFIRYAIVGFTSNIVMYALYLAATWLGVGPKTAMTIVYGLGVIQTFLFNRRWSFQFAGEPRAAFVRYAIAYTSGYFVNLIALLFLVDKLGFPHQLIQGAMILLVAVLLFLVQKYWVFPQTRRSDLA